MPSNSSTNEKTVLSMVRQLPNDSWTYDKTALYVNFKNSVITPDLSILDNYRDYFEQFLIDMEVPKRFYYSPTGFSENLYGTPDLDFIVLYFAKIPSLFQFNKPKIKVLPKAKLVELNKIFVMYKEQVDTSYKNPDVFAEYLDVEPEKKRYL